MLLEAGCLCGCPAFLCYTELTNHGTHEKHGKFNHLTVTFCFLSLRDNSKKFIYFCTESYGTIKWKQNRKRKISL